MRDLKEWLHDKQLEFDAQLDSWGMPEDIRKKSDYKQRLFKKYIEGVKYGLFLAYREVKRREENGEI